MDLSILRDVLFDADIRKTIHFLYDRLLLYRLLGWLLLAQADHSSLCLVVDADDQLLTECHVFGLLFHQPDERRLRLEDLGEVYSLEVRILLGR